MLLAPCGLDCDGCNLEPESCDGCHAESDHLWCSDCGIRVCCKFDRKLSNCSECGDFPCDKVIAFESAQYAHHTLAVKRLRELHSPG